jgi:hypothetical protein
MPQRSVVDESDYGIGNIDSPEHDEEAQKPCKTTVYLYSLPVYMTY